MGIDDIHDRTIGEYAAIMKIWNRANGSSKPAAPSNDDFEAWTARARGL